MCIGHVISVIMVWGRESRVAVGSDFRFMRWRRARFGALGAVKLIVSSNVSVSALLHFHSEKSIPVSVVGPVFVYIHVRT